jgi:hypothetical protein
VTWLAPAVFAPVWSQAHGRLRGDDFLRAFGGCDLQLVGSTRNST